MPDLLEKTMTKQELADLLVFLENSSYLRYQAI
mgnify:CR=1 FL=1